MARYVEILFRYWIRFAVILILLPAPVSLATLIYFRTYQASANLWVEDPPNLGSNLNVVTANGVSSWNQYLTPAQNVSDELTQYLQTTSFVYAVGDQMAAAGLSDTKERNAMIGSMPKNLHVTPNGSYLVSLTFSCNRATYCSGTIESTITVFRSRLTDALKVQQQLSTTFLQSQLTSAQQHANASQVALEQYLTAHPGLVVDSSTQSSLPELDRLVTQEQQDAALVTQLQSQLGQAQFTYEAADQFIQSIITVVDKPSITSGGFLGDGSSMKRAAVVWLAAIGIAAAYLVLLGWMDKTARDTKELAGRLSVPVLATMPLLPAKERF